MCEKHLTGKQPLPFRIHRRYGFVLILKTVPKGRSLTVKFQGAFVILMVLFQLRLYTLRLIMYDHRQPKNACWTFYHRAWRSGMHRVYSVYYYDKVGKTFNGNLLQRLLEYEYFANYKQKQYKIYIISNMVILLHSLKVLTSKVHSKVVKKFFFKILSKLCWGHVLWCCHIF
jgi:hypothetical protein